MIRSVDGHHVTFEDESSAEADVIVFATGYRFDMPFLPSELPRIHQGIPHVRRGESVAWPGLFCIGVPCASTPSSHFVYGIAADAQMAARTICSRLHGRRGGALRTGAAAQMFLS
jgi:putative flavoprotein involved in K+ transport